MEYLVKLLYGYNNLQTFGLVFYVLFHFEMHTIFIHILFLFRQIFCHVFQKVILRYKLIIVVTLKSAYVLYKYSRWSINKQRT